MNIFGSIYGAVHGPALRRKQFALERRAAAERTWSIERQQEFRRAEDPREQAKLKQSLWGRGLGKSTISQQDTDRLSDIQRRRNEGLEGAHRVSVLHEQYIRAKHKYQRRSQYAEYLDTIVNVALGASGAGMMGGDSGGAAGDAGSAQTDTAGFESSNWA